MNMVWFLTDGGIFPSAREWSTKNCCSFANLESLLRFCVGRILSLDLEEDGLALNIGFKIWGLGTGTFYAE